ncbi:MAG: ABC transporter ATP-binding protein [Armatimonadota bacterium]
MDPVLSFKDLTVGYRTRGGVIPAVRRVTVDLYPGETLGLIGESGSGKTTLALAALRLLPPSASVEAGKILYQGDRTVDVSDVLAMAPDALRRFRGGQVALVFQNALSALNPVLRIWAHFKDTARAHGSNDDATVRERAADLLHRVRLDPSRVLRAYPHELSGGMRQRVSLALALLPRPRVLILDEPTTALDLLTQRTIIDLLRALRSDLGFALLFISHDLALAAELADRVATMYAGRVVEIGSVDDLFYRPRHPYTAGLLAAVPRVRGDLAAVRSITGSPPDLVRLPAGCPFHPRCPYAQPDCADAEPDLFETGDAQRSACFYWHRVRAPARDATA